MSKASEQFFSSGRKNTATGEAIAKEARSVTLWLEPVITVATLARLHFEFGWPKQLLGMQSADWAFDAMAFLSSDASAEHIAGEIKKTDAEVEKLIQFMQALSRSIDPATASPRGAEKNAFKKVKALNLRKPPLFWAVGPNGLSYVFEVGYGADEVLWFSEASEARLRCPLVQA
ncbi:hypothetical protein [Labrys miyagiensis]|nr:hypothetical protein [Labrys miyagiensis]